MPEDLSGGLGQALAKGIIFATFQGKPREGLWVKCL